MILTMQDASRFLGLSEKELMKLIKNGDLAASRVNECYSFNRTELIEWALKHGIKVSPHKLSQKVSFTARSVFSLADAVKRGGIHRQVPSSNQEALMQAVIKFLPLAAPIDRDDILELMKTREALGLTGLSSGVAVPCVRSPIIHRDHSLAVALFILETPFKLFAAGDPPTQFIFEILAPSARVHLEALSALTQTFDSSELVELLREGASDEKIISYLSLMEMN
jgi:PTS system nitrogen regulatory IIA component